jgi:hypothetical protein
MTDTRPLYRPDVAWITEGSNAVPPLDAAKMLRHLDVANSVTYRATELLDRLPETLIAEHGDDVEMLAEGAYAAGVQDVLAWLLGVEPADELAGLLDLDGSA